MMSEPYQIVSIKPEGLDPLRGIRITHDVLTSFGIQFDEDSVLLLEATSDEAPEPEPLPVVEADRALAKLAAWPALGSLVYEADEGPVTVTYDGSDAPPRLQVVIISALQRAVDRRNALGRYEDLASALHRALGSTRTIMDWGIEARGFNWHDEVRRLRVREFQGIYTQLDLRGQ